MDFLPQSGQSNSLICSFSSTEYMGTDSTTRLAESAGDKSPYHSSRLRKANGKRKLAIWAWYQQLTGCWRMSAWNGAAQSTERILSASPFSAPILLQGLAPDFIPFRTMKMKTNCGLQH